jgi:hypothetical protein
MLWWTWSAKFLQQQLRTLTYFQAAQFETINAIVRGMPRVKSYADSFLALRKMEQSSRASHLRDHTVGCCQLVLC